MKILVIIVFTFIISTNNVNSHDMNEIKAVLLGISDTLNWAKELKIVADQDSGAGPKFARDVCVESYEGSKARLEQLMNSFSTWDDAVAWLSGALASNTACLDGLTETGMSPDTSVAQKLKDLLGKALVAAAKRGGGGSDKHALAIHAAPRNPNGEQGDNLATWKPGSSKADAVVAQDGSGQYKTITEAVAAVAKLGPNRPARIIIYVKSGVYNEIVNIDSSLKNLMFVGDGIGKTIITGSRSHGNTGGDTPKTATFYVLADGFWARDMTIRNTAGPANGQAVALALSSDQAVIYRCSIEGYQDTLLAWYSRQFYRDCKIHGTVDFIFGNAAAVFENCDFNVRRPLAGNYNVIAAQGRDSADSKTGFVIMGSRIGPDDDLKPMKRNFQTYLGRPWMRCSRVLFARTDMDDFIDPQGWTSSNHFKPDGSCGMFFGEFRDTGKGAKTDKRVQWPGIYQRVESRSQIRGYSIRNFIQGTEWLPATGVPFSADKI